jgi:hypothetical protein
MHHPSLGTIGDVYSAGMRCDAMRPGWLRGVVDPHPPAHWQALQAARLGCVVDGLTCLWGLQALCGHYLHSGIAWRAPACRRRVACVQGLSTIQG